MKIKKEFYSIVMLAGMVLMAPQAAVADVTAVYKMTSANGNGTQTILYADKQHVRMDLTNGVNKKTSMLKLGDKVYAITGKTVQDMSQLSKMMAALGKVNKGQHKMQAPIKYKDTGKTETIAGITGKVYRFEENGKSHEVVLGQNKDLQDAVLGVVEISKAATGMMSFDSMNRIQKNASIKSLALLRLDDRVRLKSMNTRPIPASAFKLPAKPQQMGGVGKLLKGILGR
ncbi:hypothetical protein MNBD_GAMMA24-2624 [hydrothermal vent metagenome]|uniref:DUF4412 domain-containing protein n=1 Tax=hydrothermal vent metagenome TaxID=652676 RepID=A0A3B1C7N5_9ZZZZ